MPIGESRSRSAVAPDFDQPDVVSRSATAWRERLETLSLRRFALRGRRVGIFSVVVIVGYVALAIVAYWPVLAGYPHAIYGQANEDPAQTVWFFAWTAHAIIAGHNPFFTAAVNAQSGFNLAQQAGIPLLGALALPITLTFGPVASATTFMFVAMPLSAASAYAVLRWWRVWAPAAALGGLVYGFSPYMVNHGDAHLFLVFVPLPPLIVASLWKAMTGPRRPVRWGAVLAGLIVAQYFISAEILALTAAMCAAGTAVVIIYCSQRHPDAIRLSARPASLALGAALALAGIVLAYPLWYEFAGPVHYVGPAWPIRNEWFADALDFVAPTPHQAVAPVLRAMGTRLSSFAGAEDGAYVGFAVIAVLAFLVWWCRRSNKVCFAAGLAVVSGVLSLGRYLVIDRQTGNVPLPFDLVVHLPLLNNILPIRFAFCTDACLAAVVAFALDDLSQRSHKPATVPRPRRDWAPVPAGFAFTIVSVALVVTWLPAWPYPSQAVTLLPAGLTKALPADDPIVLAYPYPVAPEDQADLWQAGARLSFRLVGVYGFVPGSGRRSTVITPLLNPPSLQEFLVREDGLDTLYPAPPPVGQVISQAKIFVARYGVQAVIVDVATLHSRTVAKMFTAALGRPSVTTGEFELWNSKIRRRGHQ